jgi:outer membrane protein OmpA-like peptidoglycan-associated protein
MFKTNKDTTGSRPAEVQNTSLQASTPAAVANQMQFDLNSSVLRPETKEVLDTLGPAMNSAELKGKRFRIQGHTDDIGAEESNRRLSQDRAASVAAYLEERYGVSNDRLVVLGKGSSEPLDPAHPDDPVNRRVQIVTLSD